MSKRMIALIAGIEEMYKLGDGKWKVTLTNGTSDDPTVYNGNTPVYVMADGDYIFSTVN